MHPAVFYACFIAMTLYLVATAVIAVRASSRTMRILAIDTSAMILVGLLVLYGVGEESSFYLEAALALGLLGFSGTLVAVRYRSGKELY